VELLNTARIAFAALRRNKVRSALTALGVIIGVASVIAMIALSSGARESIDQQIQSAGTNVVYVSAGSFGRGGVRSGVGGVQSLTIDDAQAIRDQVTTISALTPVVRGRAQLIAGDQNWGTNVEGGNEDYLTIRSWPVTSGANFTARDVLVAEKVCLLGTTVVANLFPGQDPVGQIVRIGHLPFRVEGVLATKGQGQGGTEDQDDIVIAPYTTVQKKMLGITYLQRMMVSATHADVVEATAVGITRVLRQRHHIQNPEDDDFTVRTVEEMAATRVQLADTMTGLLMSVASVSLLVGGIGIMNIMLVSVTERTKEIGLRMAVGARTRDIMRQFLVEAVALSALGGAVGIALGIGISTGLTRWLKWPTQITGASILLAFAFAGCVGVFFGYYPARKAAALDPIDALRYE
jgi:putative ABC transport system permease protein